MQNQESQNVEESQNQCSSKSINNPLIQQNKLLRKATRSASVSNSSVLEGFLQKEEFLLLENCIFNSEKINKLEERVDLETEESCTHASNFLNNVENLASALRLEVNSRMQRKDFSHTQKLLYAKEAMHQIAEIIDAAQEGFPCLYVNGEKQVFSTDVLEAGSNLLEAFERIRNEISQIYQRVINTKFYNNESEIMEDIKKSILDFDCSQVHYEKLQVFELMIIENDARRYLTEITFLERELLITEIKEAARENPLSSSERQNMIRERFIQMVNLINSIANLEGKGREDLDISILLNAEKLLMASANEQYSPVSALAKEVRGIFLEIREQVRKMGMNLECVNPQLSHNMYLVELLERFESVWEKGKCYLTSQSDIRAIKNFYTIVVEAQNASRKFAVELDNLDSSVFFVIPHLLVINAIQEQESNSTTQLVMKLLKETKSRQAYSELVQEFQKLNTQQKDKVITELNQEILEETEFQNLNKNSEEEKQCSIIKAKEKILSLIKNIGVQIQRDDPSEQSKLLNIVLGV